TRSRPASLSALPRNRLPPPITRPTCTPIPRNCPTSRAIRSSTFGSIPKSISPIRASPLSFSRIRLYLALFCSAMVISGICDVGVFFGPCGITDRYPAPVPAQIQICRASPAYRWVFNQIAAVLPGGSISLSAVLLLRRRSLLFQLRCLHPLPDAGRRSLQHRLLWPAGQQSGQGSCRERG